MFYSKFSNKKCFEAIFADDETFYRVTIFTTGFSIIFVTLPLLVASVFSFVYIELWYQVKMFCVECIIIEALLIIYMSFDLYKIIKNAKGAKSLSSKLPSAKRKLMVKSAV
jgi:ABC-type sugar transport system permease subunit